MSKAKSVYICQQCGYETGKWLGKCPNCGTWNSLVETIVQPSSSKVTKSISSLKPQTLESLNTKKLTKIKTNIDEFDQILGGGIVKGQVILISGSPGIGKSTLLLQVADQMKKVLYASGEESVGQIALRADRLKIKNKDINLIEETNIDSIIALAQNLKPDLLIVDSIQTVQTDDLSGMAGSVGQVRESAFRLVKFAKSTNTPVFLVGHVTKEGSMAGPSVLAHIVDTVLEFSGDKNLIFRIIRVNKNRFGPTDEIGVFEMKESGLLSVSNPQSLFLQETKEKKEGNVVGAIMQGSRPVLVEIESLVVPTKLPFPKRIAQGIDQKRFELLLAILTKHCRMPLYEYDCFVNVAGGIQAKNPSVDLAICLSIASSFFEKSINTKTLALGEVGLLGEIREVIGEEKIVKLAKKTGFTNIINSNNSGSIQKLIHNLFNSSKLK